MKKQSKRYKELTKFFDKNKFYSIDEAIKLVKNMATAKFNESIDTAIMLGINPKKAEESIRGTVLLPAGTGKTVKVLVFAQGDKEKEALDAGAEYVGLNDLIEKISGGWIDFDVVIATPDVMKSVSKLGKILGPKGLMPNPKIGTVTFDVADAIKKVKGGQIEFKADKYGVMKLSFGKANFSVEALKENFLALLRAILAAKPTTISSRYQYLKSICINSTMSPSVKIDLNEVWNL